MGVILSFNEVGRGGWRRLLLRRREMVEGFEFSGVRGVKGGELAETVEILGVISSFEELDGGRRRLLWRRRESMETVEI